jgi:hypothetical protein
VPRAAQLPGTRRPRAACIRSERVFKTLKGRTSRASRGRCNAAARGRTPDAPSRHDVADAAPGVEAAVQELKLGSDDLASSGEAAQALTKDRLEDPGRLANVFRPAPAGNEREDLFGLPDRGTSVRSRSGISSAIDTR